MIAFFNWWVDKISQNSVILSFRRENNELYEILDNGYTAGYETEGESETIEFGLIGKGISVDCSLLRITCCDEISFKSWPLNKVIYESLKIIVILYTFSTME